MKSKGGVIFFPCILVELDFDREKGLVEAGEERSGVYSSCLPSQHSVVHSGLCQAPLMTLPPSYGGSGGKRERQRLNIKKRNQRDFMRHQEMKKLKRIMSQ